MKKTMKRLSVFLLVALVMAMSVVPALAANTYTAFSPTGADATVTIVENLYLEKADTVVPTVTYTLEFDPNQTAPLKEDGTTAWLERSFGGTAPTVTTDTVSFSPSSTVQTEGTGDWSRYVTGNFVLDFSTVEFKEPGVFRYNLVKTISGNDAADTSNYRSGTTTDDENYILCYVTEADDGTLTLDGITYVHSNSSKIAGGRTLAKTYKDQYPAINKNLTVSKTVTGDQGSKTQYFKFTINLSGGVAGAKYKVSGSYDTTTAVTEYNSTAYNNNGSDLLKTTQASAAIAGTDIQAGNYYITLENDGTYSGSVWMQHGQSVTIEGLAKNMTYTVDEVDATATGYTETHTNSDVTADPNDASADETGTIGDNNVTVAYTNDKDGTPPTGILLQYGAPIAGILLVGGLFIVLMMTKRRKEQEAAE